jgi:hypothetical protein
MMEGQGGSAPAGMQGQGEGTDGQGAQATPDIGALVESLGQTTQSQEQMREQMTQMHDLLTSEPWKPQESQQESDALGDVDLSWLDTGDPQLDQQMAENFKTLVDTAVNQRVEQAVQQHVTPLAQQQAELKRGQEADLLTNEFPEMAQPEVARDVIKNAVEAAETFGHPELAQEPWFWRQTYLVGRALDAAQEEEGSEQPHVAHLEGAGGAVPGGGQQVDLLKLIAGGGEEGRLGRKVLPFGN